MGLLPVIITCVLWTTIGIQFVVGDCVELACVNGGTCEPDGTCACPPEFTGLRCDISNVALNKFAFQTVTLREAVASMAVDGLFPVNGRENCAHPDGDGARWWVDLGDLFLIYSVKIFFRLDGFSNRNSFFTIKMRNSTDSYDGEQLCWEQGDSGTVTDITLNCTEPIYGRVVEFHRYIENGEKATLCEVQVMATQYEDVGDCTDSAAVTMLTDCEAGIVSTDCGIDRTGSQYTYYAPCAAKCFNLYCFNGEQQPVECDGIGTNSACNLTSVAQMCSEVCGPGIFQAKYQCSTQTYVCSDYCCCRPCPPGRFSVPGGSSACESSQGPYNDRACHDG